MRITAFPKRALKINAVMKEKLKSDFYGGFATDRETYETINYVFKDNKTKIPSYANKLNERAIIPAVIRPMDVSWRGFGTLARLTLSRTPAKSTRASPKPIA